MAAMPQVTGGTQQPQLSPVTLRVIQQAQQYMTAMGDSFVSTDHLLLALARTGQFGLDDKGVAVLPDVDPVRGQPLAAAVGVAAVEVAVQHVELAAEHLERIHETPCNARGQCHSASPLNNRC